VSAVTATTTTGGEEAPRGLLSTLWKAWHVHPGEKLNAEEAASTLFRFFRSKHVRDLRLFVKLALFLFVIYVGAVLLLTFAAPILHWYLGGRAVYGTGLVLDARISEVGYRRVLGAVTSISPAITICGAIIAWSYLAASKRLGVVDLFACEISTLCRVGTLFDIGIIYTDMYKSDSPPKKHRAARHMAGKHLTKESKESESKESSSFISDEQYFSIFEHNSSDLEALEALVARYITEYYTYMKATRDLLRKLASIHVSEISPPPDHTAAGSAEVDLWHKTVADIIYVVFLGYESARKAIADLIEFQPAQAENTIVIAFTELVCFRFLCEYLRTDPSRFARLRLREADYTATFPALINEVNEEYETGRRSDWIPAHSILPELKTRYEEAIKTLHDCIK
jgi:hypothetical protein